MFIKSFLFSSQVKTEILRIGKYDKSVEKIMIDLISGIRITKLVMSLKFMRHLSWYASFSVLFWI